MIKKKALLLFVLVLMLCLGGCNKAKPGSAEEKTAASKDYVYTLEELGNGETASINQILQYGDNIYAYGYVWPEDGTTARIEFYKINEDGSYGEKTVLNVAENVSYNTMKLAEDGTIYCIKNVYPIYSEEPDMEATTEDATTEEATTEDATTEEAATEEVAEEEAVVEDAVEEDTYYLVKMELDGTELFSVNINEIPELKEIGEKNGYFYVNDIIMPNNEALYISAMESIVKFDAEGNFQKIVANADSPLINATLVPLTNGKVAAILYEDAGASIAYADMEAGTIGDKFKVPGLSYEYSYYPGIGYDLYMVNTYGVYGYNVGDSDKKQLMSYIDSDLAFYNLYAVTGIDEKTFIAMYDDEVSGYGILGKFTKVDPKDVKDKEIITLAMAYSDWSVRTAVVNFNKNSDTTRINIMDYSSLYGTEVDYSAGLTKLNTDIVSGNVPDILLLDNSMPVDSYISKGLFEDVLPYIEKDEELDINDLMPNVIEAFSKDGKMYSIVPSYCIQTLAAKTSDVGAERGWTVKEAQEILASKPEGTQFLGMTPRDQILQYSMSMAGNEFIDWNTGQCHFNSEGFIELLEFVNTFPEVIDDSDYTDEYWNNYESMWREGKVLTSLISIGDFRNFNYTEKGTFGEDITLIGFPTANGDGSVIIPNLRLAMSAKSKNKEAAWEFLRIFLTDEYQDSENMWGLPLSINKLDEMAEAARTKPFYEDENGEKVEYDDTYYVSGMEIIIDPMTEQETEELKQELYSFTQVYSSNEAILKIIQEEAAPYFSGQKKAKDVADIIQSRIQIYVNENR